MTTYHATVSTKQNFVYLLRLDDDKGLTKVSDTKRSNKLFVSQNVKGFLTEVFKEY